MTSVQFEQHVKLHADKDWAFYTALSNPSLKLESLTTAGVIELAEASEFGKMMTTQFNIKDAVSTQLFEDGKWHTLLVANSTLQQGQISKDRVLKLKAFLPILVQIAKWNLESTTPNYRSYLEAVINLQRLPSAVYDQTGSYVTSNEAFDHALISAGVISSSIDQDCWLNTRLKRDYYYKIAEIVRKNDRPYYEINQNLAIPQSDLQLIMTPLKDKDGVSIGGLVSIITTELSFSLSNNCANLFNFTQAECEICQCLLMGQVVKSIAVQRQTTEYTVRDQVKSIFKKTKTSSQHALVSLLSSIPLS